MKTFLLFLFTALLLTATAQTKKQKVYHDTAFEKLEARILRERAERESSFNVIMEHAQQDLKDIEFKKQMKDVEVLLYAQKQEETRRSHQLAMRIILAIATFSGTLLIAGLIRRMKNKKSS